MITLIPIRINSKYVKSKVFCNTIGKKVESYENHYFNIVHPKLDAPSVHCDLVREENKIIIKSKTINGQKGIAMLKLDQEPHTIVRGKNLINHFYELSDEAQQLFDQLLQ
jgi:hypothetical protein